MPRKSMREEGADNNTLKRNRSIDICKEDSIKTTLIIPFTTGKGVSAGAKATKKTQTAHLCRGKGVLADAKRQLMRIRKQH